MLKLIPVAAALTLFAGAAAALDTPSEKAPTAGKAQMTMEKQEAPAPVAEIGKPAPDFTLTDLQGNQHTLSKYVKEGKTVVLEWFNPDCPFVRKHHVTFDSMVSTQQAFADRDVVWLAVNSGAPGNQGAGMERNLKAVADYGMHYPLLLDESGDVGRMYGAKTTPQMYVIQDGVLVFNGPLDNERSPQTLGDVNYVKDVLEQCLAGKSIEPQAIKSYGCSVKYAS